MESIKRMLSDFRDWLRWLKRRDSESASIVIIRLSFDLSKKDIVQMRDYFESLRIFRDFKK